MDDGWDQAEERLRAWRMRAERTKAFQQAASRSLHQYYLRIGVPTVLLSALTAGLGFLGLGFDGNMAMYIGISIGCLGTVATIMTALQTFLNFGKASESHQRASVRFGDVARDIEAVLAIPRKDRGDISSVVNRFSERMNAAAGESPPVSERIINRTHDLYVGDKGDGKAKEA